MSETLTESQEKTLSQYREDLKNGTTLVRHAASHRSRYGYQPPINRSNWAHMMRTLADMAASSDRMAAVANHIIGRVNLYGTDAQACARAYEMAFEAMNTPYVDVIGLAGPEPGRRSDRTHDWTLYDRVAVHYWLELATRGMTATAPGVGWCLAAVAQEVGFYPTHAMRER